VKWWLFEKMAALSFIGPSLITFKKHLIIAGFLLILGLLAIIVVRYFAPIIARNNGKHI
jgi:hypothetical protein